MAASHVAVCLLPYIFFATSILPLGHFHHLGLTTCSCIVTRRFSLGHQCVKLPILKWSKHGVTTISLPDIQYVVGADFVFLCGDIHPHPGPRSTLKSSGNGTTTRLDYQPLFGKWARAPPRTHGWIRQFPFVGFNQSEQCPQNFVGHNFLA